MSASKRKVLAPHKEQDGWAYIRVKTFGNGLVAPDAARGLYVKSPQSIKYGLRGSAYVDTFPDSRTISSRRVERAVETDDYLRLCQDEMLCVTVGHRGCDEHSRFSVFGAGGGPCFGSTLREAYHRYHAALGDAMRPDDNG